MEEKHKNIKEETVKVTEEERDKILEDLVFKGETFYNTKILNDKIEISLKSLSGEDQLWIDSEMSLLDGSPADIMHNYAIKLLTKVLVKYGKEDLTSMPISDKEKRILKLPASIIDVITAKNSEFFKKIKACLDGEEIEETFFENPSTSSE